MTGPVLTSTLVASFYGYSGCRDLISFNLNILCPSSNCRAFYFATVGSLPFIHATTLFILRVKIPLCSFSSVDEESCKVSSNLLLVFLHLHHLRYDSTTLSVRGVR